jgi:hypothetical protein
MKTLTHVVLPLAILMAIVGVVGYITQNTSRSPDLPGRTKPADNPTTGDALTFDDPVDLDARAREVEFQSHNTKDFWFHSNQEKPLELSLEHKSCTCTDVFIGTFAVSDAEWQDMTAGWNTASRGNEWKLPSETLSLTNLCRLVGALEFTPLFNMRESKGKGLPLPATAPGKTPRPYLLRMNWEAKKLPQEMQTAEQLSVKLGALVEGAPAMARFDKDFSYVVVPSVGFFPPSVDLGEISANGSRSLDCIVWSVTRDHLSFKARMLGIDGNYRGEPCAEISEPVEMPLAERERLPASFGKEFAKTHFRSAYRFTLILHEHRGDDQLEIGPLSRQMVISFTTGRGEAALEDLKPTASALVRGPIRVLTGDDRGKVYLGTYKFDRGKTIFVRLAADDPKMELTKDTVSDNLVVTIGAPTIVDERKEWEMKVEMKPNGILGDLPASTMIVLKTVGPNPRRLRIPVTGKADR